MNETNQNPVFNAGYIRIAYNRVLNVCVYICINDFFLGKAKKIVPNI